MPAADNNGKDNGKDRWWQEWTTMKEDSNDGPDDVNGIVWALGMSFFNWFLVFFFS